MAPGRGAGDARTLRRQRGIQPLALGVKTLQHSHALGHAFNEIGFCDGHVLLHVRRRCAIIAQR
jgi:hypothetical protein